MGRSDRGSPTLMCRSSPPARMLGTRFVRRDEFGRCRPYVPATKPTEGIHRERHRHTVHHPGRDRVGPGRVRGHTGGRLGVPARPRDRRPSAREIGGRVVENFLVFVALRDLRRHRLTWTAKVIPQQWGGGTVTGRPGMPWPVPPVDRGSCG
jgi:hypothetical protein